MDVSSVLNNLGGVYRDPSRVDRDASTLLRSSMGSNLRPNVSQLDLNTGESHAAIMVLSGTLPITYKGQQYHVPLDIYVTPPYPVRPPVVFIRPLVERNMVLKENHPHVAVDGMVYLPYLHEWRPHSHNLTELAVSMSSTFGHNPPVFAQAAGGGGRGGGRAATSDNSSMSSAASAGSGGVRMSPNPRFGAAQSRREEEEARRRRELEEARRRREEEVLRRRREEDEEVEKKRQRERELEMNKEVEEANRAAAVARQVAAKEVQDSRRKAQLKEQLTRKLQGRLRDLMDTSRIDISGDLQKQQQLETGATAIETQLEQLNSLKEELETQTKAADEATVKIEAWIAHAQETRQQQQQVPVDDLCAPVNPNMAQMLQLSAQSAAIADALYFLDKALAKGSLELDVHLKMVRRLAKKQFLARAHLLKIGQVLNHPSLARAGSPFSWRG